MSIESLATLAKTATNTQQYVKVENTTTFKKYKFLIQSLFPSMSTTGTGGQDLFISVTNSNQYPLFLPIYPITFVSILYQMPIHSG